MTTADDEPLRDDVVLDVEEYKSTYEHLAQRDTRFYAGVLGASDAFLQTVAIGYAPLAVNNNTLCLYMIVGFAGVLVGLGTALFRSVLAEDKSNAEKVYEDKKMQMLAQLPVQNSLVAKAAQREESGLSSKLAALYIAYADTREDFVNSAPAFHACGFVIGGVTALAAYWYMISSHLPERPLLLPAIAVSISLSVQGAYAGGYRVLILAISISVVKSVYFCVTYVLKVI